MLTVSALYKKLSRRMILHDIDLALGEGVYGLLGANGAGKTTLIRCLCGLYRLNGGSVEYDGQAIAKSEAYRMQMGYLPQAFGMFKQLTLYEMLEYFATLKGIADADQRAAIEESLRRVNLEDRIASRVSTLSGGMVRRAGIAQALLGEAKVLLFDEPTSGLDPEERLRFKSLLSRIRPGKTILISTHIVEDVEAGCDQVIVIHEGRILFVGTCEQLRVKAAGKVYELPEADLAKAGEKSYTVRTYERGGAMVHRLLAQQGPEDTAREPRLEDGYLALIKGI